jgi:hypothetical protein
MFISAAASNLYIHATVVFQSGNVTIWNTSTVNTDKVSLALLRENRPFIAMNVIRQSPLVLLLRQVGDSVVRCEVKKVACCEVGCWEGGCSRGRS